MKDQQFSSFEKEKALSQIHSNLSKREHKYN